MFIPPNILGFNRWTAEPQTSNPACTAQYLFLWQCCKSWLKTVFWIQQIRSIMEKSKHQLTKSASNNHLHILEDLCDFHLVNTSVEIFFCLSEIQTWFSNVMPSFSLFILFFLDCFLEHNFQSTHWNPCCTFPCCTPLYSCLALTSYFNRKCITLLESANS